MPTLDLTGPRQGQEELAERGTVPCRRGLLVDVLDDDVNALAVMSTGARRIVSSKTRSPFGRALASVAGRTWRIKSPWDSQRPGETTLGC
jgi:hypothetical protein